MIEPPFVGRWMRGEEHETKRTFRCGNVTITLSIPYGDADWMKPVERWLVDALQCWPHPNAPGPKDVDPCWQRMCYESLQRD